MIITRKLTYSEFIGVVTKSNLRDAVTFILENRAIFLSYFVVIPYQQDKIVELIELLVKKTGHRNISLIRKMIDTFLPELLVGNRHNMFIQLQNCLHEYPELQLYFELLVIAQISYIPGIIPNFSNASTRFLSWPPPPKNQTIDIQHDRSSSRRHFQRVYECALSGSETELAKLIPLHPNPYNKYGVHSMPIVPTCYYTAGSHRGVCVIEQLARDGQDSAANFLARILPKYHAYEKGVDSHFGYILSGYAMAGNDDKVEILFQRLCNECGNDETAIRNYEDFIIRGYAMVGNTTKARQYSANNPRHIGCLVYGLARAGLFDEVLGLISELKGKIQLDTMVRAIQGFAMAGLKDLIDTLFERVSFTIPRPLDKICKYLTSGGFIHLAMDLIPDNEEGEEILKYIMNETACLRSEENIEMIFAHPYLARKQSETIIYMIKACATELWVDMANNLLGRYKLSHTNQQYLNACRVVASIYASIGLIKPFIDIYKSIGYAEMDASGYIRNGWIDQYIQVTLICKRNELHNLQSNQLQAKLSSLKLNSSKTVDVGLYLLTATVSATTAAFFIDRPESFRRVLAHINNDFTRLIFASAWGMGQSLDQCAVYNDMLQSRRLTFSMLERNMLDMLPILEKAKLNYGLATYRQAHVLRKKHAREILLMLGRYLQFLSLDIVLLHIVPIITGLNIAEARQLHAAVSLNTYQNATLFCQQSNTSTDNLETHYTTKNGCKHRL